MKLSSVLHLYLGQEFIHTATKDETVYKLNAERFSIIMNDEDFDNIHLLLRPLSDATPGEMDDYYNIRRDGKGLIEGEAGAMLWVLSKGFDLFGLIESGQAIDKTKLSNKN